MSAPDKTLIYKTYIDMKTLAFFFAIFLIISLTACNKNKTEPIQEPTQIHLSEKAGQVIAKSNAFGTELFKAVALEDSDKNLMISPLSASVALTMLMNGCDGETYSQIHDMLGYEGLTSHEVNAAYNSLVQQLLAADQSTELALANALWYRNSFTVLPSYLQTMQTDFDAHIQGLNFASPSALQTMNNWASDNTNGKIPVVLNEISPDAVMFLMNALYFKGIWTEQFTTENTYNSPFTLDDDSEINIPTMHGMIPAKAYFTEDYKAIELFYGRKNFSMIVLVPNSSINNFLGNTTPETWTNLTAQLDMQTMLMDFHVSLPKFTFEYEKRLNEQLKALGMTDAFNSAVANLTKIADENIFVSFVKQNTFVEVNEEGTEAAAVTTIGIELTSAGDPPEFDVDKPFIFSIREQTTNTFLFMGQVINPE